MYQNQSNIPNLNSSNAVNQMEKQKVQQYMNSAQNNSQVSSASTAAAAEQLKKQQIQQYMSSQGNSQSY